ncbi:MAG: class I fructose-bisphosphate aldolase [Pseudomonadota bacterium]|jgi:fructose-bisphosphate aldolase class I|nr:class I fructose-bisphosphate aldolase [Pseudomonadota bacterium]|tara:strand:+ start:260 stop:1267 length:1008 start_codon:yes stop_codon:yes gene_type:complete
MNKTDLKETARNLVSDSKGILAMDESFPTIKKRFEKLNIEDTEKNRQIYRDLLVTAPDLNKYISGAILFDETIKQQTLSGQSFPDFLNSINIIPGIKVDAGAKPFSCHPGEKITEGLDGLDSRMKNYYSLGARFAKWRAVINISEENNLPSDASLIANANALARYASICQENNIVPIVEPEVLMDGDHPIELTLEKTSKTLSIVFDHLNFLDVYLEGIILKPSMVIEGVNCPKKNDSKMIASSTIKCLSENVPQDVPGIAFLSGGQSDDDATNNLNEMNIQSQDNNWKLTFSYGRALQQAAMTFWSGKDENIESAKKIVMERAKVNSLAAAGKLS